MKEKKDIYKAVLLGVAVGDALGVPVEFRDRQSIAKNPVIDMIGYGTYNLPPGTWSDDSSLTFCLAEALTKGYDLKAISQNFINWLYHKYWTPYNSVFDVGNTTRESIYRLKNGVQPELAGAIFADENGNGSLMRILPLLFYIKDKPIEERFQITQHVSSITHAHIRSVIACFYYLEFARALLTGSDKFIVYKEVNETVLFFLQHLTIDEKEISYFDRILKNEIHRFEESEIRSSGYVIHTLEASLWCLLTTNNYREATLKAVNLGNDTDTTSAVTGGLAALLYGHESIPQEWVNQIARLADIENLAERCRINII